MDIPERNAGRLPGASGTLRRPGARGLIPRYAAAFQRPESAAPSPEREDPSMIDIHRLTPELVEDHIGFFSTPRPTTIDTTGPSVTASIG